MTARDYYFDESVVCICGHHVHARMQENLEVCKCDNINHAIECPVSKAFNKPEDTENQ